MLDCGEGGLYGSQPLLHLFASLPISGNLQGLGDGIKLVMEFSPSA